MRNLPERAQPCSRKLPLHFGAQGLLEQMGTTLIIPSKYVLKHLPPDPGKRTALKNNLSNRNKASYLDHHSKPSQGTGLPLKYTIFSAVMPISVLSLAPCDLLNSKIMLQAVPSYSFPPRGS